MEDKVISKLENGVKNVGNLSTYTYVTALDLWISTLVDFSTQLLVSTKALKVLNNVSLEIFSRLICRLQYKGNDGV